MTTELRMRSSAPVSLVSTRLEAASFNRTAFEEDVSVEALKSLADLERVENGFARAAPGE